MKKLLSIILSTIMLIAAAVTPVAADEEKVTVKVQIDNPVMTVNGEEYAIDENGTMPVIVNDRTLIPVRAVIEAIGGTVDWNDAAKTVTLNRNTDEITLTIGSTTAYCNGEIQILDTAPEIINDRTMFPIRFVAESFGYTVIWSQEKQTATIIDADKIEHIIPRGDLNPSAPRFTGISYMNAMSAYDENIGIPTIGQVTFEPCTRTDWHYHDGGQILLVTEGVGVLGIEGETSRLMQPGDVIFIEPGKVHFHSAMNDSWFAHVALSPNPANAKTNWLGKVSDEEYYAAITDALAHGTIRETSDTIFNMGERIEAEGYLGTLYKNMLIETENVYNCPEVHNFTLEAGAKTAWHSHESGQLIVVTGGTGIYQEEGQKPQLLNAGDVIVAQPGVKHWHGAADEKFTYIASNGNANGSNIVWGDNISNEEYSEAVYETTSAMLEIAVQSESAEGKQIKMTAGATEVMITLNSSKAASDLVKMLPLELTLIERNDFAKGMTLPENLSSEESTTREYEIGDFGYWDAGPDLAIFYDDIYEQTVVPVIPLGKAVSGAEKMADTEGIVKLELVETVSD